MRIKRMFEKFTDSCKKLWGWIVSWTQKLKKQKFAGWILSAISVTVLIGIGIAVNRYFLYTSDIKCLEQLNIFKILFLSNSPEDIECIKQSGFWETLSDAEEPLNIRNLILGFAGMVGLGLAGWRSWVGERQTRATEERRLEERRAEQRNEERRLDERFANAVESLSKELSETSYPAHLGAITALRDLAVSNNDYTQRCLDILCSCNKWMEGYLDKFSCRYDDTCFADIHLAANNRIVPNKSNSKNPIKLEHERRSQQALNSVATILDKISKKDNNGYSAKNIDLFGKTLCGINLHRHEISGINLNNAYLNGANLHLANMQGAKLSNAHLQSADIREVNLQAANLSYANLQGAMLYKARLKGALLVNANLKKADLRYIQAAGTNFHDAKGANFNNANLEGAELRNIDAKGATFVGANLKDADLSESALPEADLTNANLYAVNLKEAYIYRTNFHNANIQKATLVGANITRSNLIGANMTKSNLQGISIEQVNCRSTIFNQAKMHAVDFIDCEIRGAMFISSELQSASFNKSKLENCTLLGCNLYGVEMENNNFQNIIFDTISDTGNIKTKGARDTWIKGIGEWLIDSTNVAERINRIQQAWDKTDKEEMPKGLNALQQASILEKDTKGHWIIKPSKIEELKEFYRAFIIQLNGELSFFPTSDVIDMISKSHEHLSKDYSEIQKTLKAILVELKKELKNKGR